MSGPTVAGVGNFSDYVLESRFRDEIFYEDGTLRLVAERLGMAFNHASSEQLKHLQERVRRQFLHEGITFTVIGKMMCLSKSFRLTAFREFSKDPNGIKLIKDYSNAYRHSICSSRIFMGIIYMSNHLTRLRLRIHFTAHRSL